MTATIVLAHCARDRIISISQGEEIRRDNAYNIARDIMLNIAKVNMT